MEKSTLLLILLLVIILLFASHIQYYTGRVVQTWFTQPTYCSDSDNGFYPFISGVVNYPYQTRMYKYIDACNGNTLYEGTCKNGNLLKVPFKCPYGCSGNGADSNGACICKKDLECPAGNKCNGGICSSYTYTNR